MDYTQHTITIGHAIHQNAKGKQVMDIVEILTQGGVPPNLLVYAVDVLGSAGYLGLEPRPVKFLA